jgi:hypothetical protein
VVHRQYQKTHRKRLETNVSGNPEQEREWGVNPQYQKASRKPFETNDSGDLEQEREWGEPFLHSARGCNWARTWNSSENPYEESIPCIPPGEAVGREPGIPASLYEECNVAQQPETLQIAYWGNSFSMVAPIVAFQCKSTLQSNMNPESKRKPYEESISRIPKAEAIVRREPRIPAENLMRKAFPAFRRQGQ